MIEQRAMERFKLRLPVRISYREQDLEDPVLEFSTTNVCSGGAYLQTDTPLPLDTKVRVRLILPFNTQREGYRNAIKINGSVIRVDDQGMAINFDKTFKLRPTPVDDLGVN